MNLKHLYVHFVYMLLKTIYNVIVTIYEYKMDYFVLQDISINVTNLQLILEDKSTFLANR